jgi:hypothetical protein
MMIARRERQDLVQVLALHPQLVFAGSVARIFSPFEHGDHDDFDADWRDGGRSGLGK